MTARTQHSALCGHHSGKYFAINPIGVTNVTWLVVRRRLWEIDVAAEIDRGAEEHVEPLLIRQLPISRSTPVNEVTENLKAVASLSWMQAAKP